VPILAYRVRGVAVCCRLSPIPASPVISGILPQILLPSAAV
jgi:hypothetical protein